MTRKIILCAALAALLLCCVCAAAAEETAVKRGDIIVFGSYNQDDVGTNGREPIEWLVLDVRDGKALLISVCGLDMQYFDPSEKDNKWETCALRAWMNKTFAEKAFTQKELAAIPVTEADNGKAQHVIGSIADDPPTSDRFFLLSYAEADTLFDSDEARRCIPTPHTKARGVVMWEDKPEEEWDCCWWWLRSPGSDYSYAAYVYADGSISNNRALFVAPMAVRPACWLDLDAWSALTK